MKPKWYQIYTKSNAEKKLYNKICACGFEVFLPVRRIKRQWSERVKIIEQPAFKSYLFAKLTQDDMRFIERLSGFCFFVTFGSPNKSVRNAKRSYPNITDLTIKLISLILNEYPDAMIYESILLKGDKIEFTQGRLQKYQGILIEHSSETKVAIKIPELKQAMLINVPVAMIKKLP